MTKTKLNPIEVARKQAQKESKARAAKSKKLLLDSLMGSMGIPMCVSEHKFHPTRNWRFDYAWPEKRIALEVEGGVFSGGRHTNPNGFMGDMEKYNECVLHGWRLIRTTPSLLLSTGTADLIRQLYNQK